MKRKFTRIVLLPFVVACSIGVSQVYAQDVADPLTIQGLSNFVSTGARSSAMGGASVAAGDDPTVLFSNPAALANVQGFQIRLGGMINDRSYSQTQQWSPDRLYAGLSLLFANDLGGIIDTSAQKLQKPFDNIMPDWSHSNSQGRPSLIALSVHFSLGSAKIVAGIGFSQFIDLYQYYQNNNALDPNIGSLLPTPILRLQPGDSMEVNWYQFERARNGIIYQVTPAVSVQILHNLSIGVSAAILTGTSDDFQYSRDRGLITLLTSGAASYNVFNLDSVYNRQTTNGTSKYSGVRTNIGLFFKQKYFSVGISVVPPMTITRSWSQTVTVDSTGGSGVTSTSGTDKIDYPLMYTIGLSLNPTDRWVVAFDYTANNFSKVVYHAAGDSALNPWLDGGGLHLGAEYRAAGWLSIRGGYATLTEPFASAGAGIQNQPVSGAVYTFGLGFKMSAMTVNVTYNYSLLNYDDTWVSNTNFNQQNVSSLTLELGYRP